MVLGELVKLRAIEPAEADDVWRWNHDADVMRWLHNGYGESLASVRKRLAERAPNTFGNVLYGVEVLADAKLIGVVRLRDAEPEAGIADLDIYLGEKDYWGRGFGTDVMRTMCRYGFEVMRLHKITLTVVAENHAAHHVYKKIGFVDEGRLREEFRHDGKWYDTFTMGLLAGELR
jgi:RimJ/RimL family protein N-acetyltransferase